jgi:hypothetical protein
LLSNFSDKTVHFLCEGYKNDVLPVIQFMAFIVEYERLFYNFIFSSPSSSNLISLLLLKNFGMECKEKSEEEKKRKEKESKPKLSQCLPFEDNIKKIFFYETDIIKAEFSLGFFF